MSVDHEFQRLGIHAIQDFTYKGTYVIATLSNLLSEQSYNRGSKRWTKAEYVVLDTAFSGPDQKKMVLNAWCNLTKFHDQYIFVPEPASQFSPSKQYTVYNYAARPLGTGTITDLLNIIKK